jgi:hypothetical protein
VRRDVTRPPLGKAIGLQETAQGGVGGYRLEIGAAFGERDEIVVVQLCSNSYDPEFAKVFVELVDKLDPPTAGPTP